MNISISNVHFLINCPDVPLRHKLYRTTYASFMGDTGSSDEGSVSIEVNLDTKDFPDTKNLKRTFEVTDSWSMFRNEDEYFWIDIPPPAGPTCLARFHRPLEKAIVYCAKELIVEESGKMVLMSPFSYPLDQLLLMYALSDREGALVHASAVEFDGKGFIFAGRSGAGKSTISRALMGKGCKVLSDDRVVIRKIRTGFRVFGTPWSGEAEIAENGNLPLCGIFFIHHGSDNRIEKVTPREAVENFMSVTSVPWFDKTAMPGILSFCEDLVLHIPAYKLSFRPGEEVVNLIAEFASRQSDRLHSWRIPILYHV